MLGRFRSIRLRGKLISTYSPFELAKPPRHAIISAPRLLPSAFRSSGTSAEGVSLAQDALYMHEEITLAQVAVYIHEEINGTFDDIFHKLSELVDLMELPNNGSITQVNLDDAIMFIEEIGACPANFKDFLARDALAQKALGSVQLPQEDIGRIDIESHDISEYDWVKSSDQLVPLASRHGAKVTARRGGGWRIITASGAEIVLIRDGRGSWSGLERKRTLVKFKAAGLTTAEPPEDAPRYCTWCNRFLTIHEAKSCKKSEKSKVDTLCWKPDC